MHVIVGQGQLDAVLHAKPEDRRAFIEEAAGVLKHRKRKEKALRKLDAMQTNLNRLTDLTAELRRQLKPLGRQAEVARRAAGIQADLRDARLRLLADDLATLRDDRSTRRSPTRPRCASGARRSRRARRRSQERLAELEARARRGRAGAGRGAGHLVQAVRACRSASGPPSSWPPSGCRNLSAEPEEERPGRDPDQLAAEAERVREQEERAARGARRRPGPARPRRSRAGRSWSASWPRPRRRWSRRVKAIADRREGLAKLAGQVNAGAHPRRPPPPRRSPGSPPRTPRRRPGPRRRRRRTTLAAAGATEADRDNADLDARHAEAVAAARGGRRAASRS